MDSNQNDVFCNTRKECEVCDRILNTPYLPTESTDPIKEQIEDIEKYVHKVIENK